MKIRNLMYECMGLSERLCHPRIYKFLMVNNWFVIKGKRLKIGDLTKFNKFSYLLKSICKLSVTPSVIPLLHIKWSDRRKATRSLQWREYQASTPFLRQSVLRWLGHVSRMKDGRIHKDLLCGELVIGKRSHGRQ